jgi:hypothetical protein
VFNIYDYVQVNSNFFFANEFSKDFSGKNYSAKVPLKLLNENNIQYLLEDIAFGDEHNALYLKTNKGCFFLFHISDLDNNKTTIEMLKNNSTTTPTYLFSNVDYFTYGRFGIAENGKITRFLSANSEAENEEDIVTWIGKPHKFEYETHTFYTKQKLIDCEMFFDSDTVCEMIEFYLPFINAEIDILEAKIFSNNKNIKTHLKSVLTNKKSFDKFDKTKYKNAINHLIDNHAPYFSTLIVVKKNGNITLTNRMICAYEEISPTAKILFSNRQENINILRTSKEEFYNMLLNFVYDYANAEITTLAEASKKLPLSIYDQNHYLMQIMGKFENYYLKPNLSYDTGRFYNKSTDEYLNKNRSIVDIGTKINKKYILTLYDEIIKNTNLL